VGKHPVDHLSAVALAQEIEVGFSGERLAVNGEKMDGRYLPGYPASHGCIRMPHAFAELLFSNVSIGVPVDVVPK